MVEIPAGWLVSELENRPYARFPLASFVTTVRQIEFWTFGLTHASSVIPVDRSSELVSAIVTQSLTPSKERAPPFLPAAQTAPESVPWLPLPEVSATEVPEPASNEYAPTSPAGSAAREPPAMAAATTQASSIAGMCARRTCRSE